VGLSDAGVYSLNSNIIAAAFLINFSLSYVIYPHLSHLWESGNMNAVRGMLEAGQRVFVFLALPIATGVVLIYEPLIEALVGDQFLLTLSSVVFICVGQIMLGMCAICSFAIDLSKATAMYLKILVITVALNLILNALAVPSFGVAGAAGATATTYFLQFLFMWYLSARLLGFKLHFDLKFLALCAVGTSIMWAALKLLGPVETLLDIGLVVFTGAIVYGLVSVLLFRRQLADFTAMLRGR
jgi:O-antigen/teichoic acid export membrane protein